MSTNFTQEFLKEKYSEFNCNPVGVHQRAHDYLKLRDEDVEVLAFLLVESETNELNIGNEDSIAGFRNAIQVLISEKLAKRQEELAMMLEATGRRLSWVGIAVAAVGTIATIITIFL